MPTLPLIAHATPEHVVAWRADGARTCAVTRRQFLADVMDLAGRLPAGGNLINLCNDRYHFSVGLAAAAVSGKTSLLPPTHAPGMIRRIREFAADVFCLTDDDGPSVDLPQVRYPKTPASAAYEPAIPQIDIAQRFAVLFTSGSTGTPQPHPKTWGALVASVTAEAACFGLPRGEPCHIIGTVPPQHMFGFESTVLMAWHNGFAYSHTQPFYPADIVAALAAVPAPRVLVSSPVHLRALLESQLAVPPLARVVCATAPLSTELAQAVETRCGAPLMEIYGSTETGQAASRRTTQGAAWRLFPGVTFTREGERTRASGGHVETPVEMSDLIEPLDDHRFLLHGRLADMINIAGKRHSLASLNHLLNAIPGVTDGTFYMPDPVPEGAGGMVTRLAACAVAPGMDAPAILAALREHLDPVFLPRPLLLVDALPRTSVSKLPRDALRALFHAHGYFQETSAAPARCTARGTHSTEWQAPADHPVFAGHFPGAPMVPGVMLLDALIAAVAADRGEAMTRCVVDSVKFVSPALPGETLLIARETQSSGAVRFEITAGTRKIASGVLSVPPPDSPPPIPPA